MAVGRRSALAAHVRRTGGLKPGRYRSPSYGRSPSELLSEFSRSAIAAAMASISESLRNGLRRKPAQPTSSACCSNTGSIEPVMNTMGIWIAIPEAFSPPRYRSDRQDARREQGNRPDWFRRQRGSRRRNRIAPRSCRSSPATWTAHRAAACRRRPKPRMCRNTVTKNRSRKAIVPCATTHNAEVRPLRLAAMCSRIVAGCSILDRPDDRRRESASADATLRIAPQHLAQAARRYGPHSRSPPRR